MAWGVPGVMCVGCDVWGAWEVWEVMCRMCMQGGWDVEGYVVQLILIQCLKLLSLYARVLLWHRFACYLGSEEGARSASAPPPPFSLPLPSIAIAIELRRFCNAFCSLNKIHE